MSKWSAIAALGEMAKGGGAYFGQMYSESVKTQRLKEAREARIEELQMQDRLARERATESNAMAVARDGGSVKQYVTDENGQMWAMKGDGTSVMVEDGPAMATSKPAAPAKVKEYRTTTDGRTFAMFDDGTMQEMEGLAPEAGGTGKITEGQRTNELRSKQGLTALNEMESIIGSGYDPTNVGGFKDQLFSGNKWTNWLASDEGKSFESAAIRAVEPMLRAATGAAATEPEVNRYRLAFIPQAGDDKDTVSLKLNATRRQLQWMYENSGALEQMSPEQRWDTIKVESNRILEQSRNELSQSEPVINTEDNNLSPTAQSWLQ